MSVITIMNGVPLYTTKKEALSWAFSNNLKGYHMHTHGGVKGYMGGQTHTHANKRNNYTSFSQQQPPLTDNQDTNIPPVPVTPVGPTPIRTTTTTTTGGNGNGGY